MNVLSPYPYIRKSLEILDAHFVDLVIEKQDILSCKERWDGMLALIADAARNELNSSWSETRRTQEELKKKMG